MKTTLTSILLILASCSSTNNSHIARNINSTPVALGRLEWRMDVAGLKSETSDPQTLLGEKMQNLLQQASKDLVATPTLSVMSAFTHEGKLQTDPSYIAFSTAHKDFAILYRFALCAKSGDEKLADECAKTGRYNLMRWVQTFKFSGQPMTEVDFLQVFTSADLLIDSMPIPDKILLRDWLVSAVKTSDAFYKSKKTTDTSLINNHNTWRLAVRTIALKIIGDSKMLNENSRLISEHAKANLLPPREWKPDPKCPNNFNEKTYGSYDFRQRDALHYHVGNLEAWTWMALMVPSQIDANTRKTILEAFEFLRPYFTGEKVHKEFVCSTIGFDAKRASAGQEGFAGNWKPEQAYKLLQMARAAFPEIRSWSEAINESRYDIWRETLAGIQQVK
ncbi:MAG: alginate lyase family protein [Bdellovibrionota bacterium]